MSAKTTGGGQKPKKEWPKRPGPKNPPPDERRCTGTSKQTGERCGNYRVKGYDVCYYHGANPKNRGGAPKGNKNRVTTGEHETIHFDTLDSDEMRLWDQITTELKAQLDEEIRLITIRERRMLQRIARLREADMTVVEELEQTEGEELRPVDEDYGTGVVVVNKKTTTAKRRASLGQIQAIEEALTRVQAQKARLLELKHRVDGGDDDEHPDLDAYIEALEGAATDVWSGEQ